MTSGIIHEWNCRYNLKLVSERTRYPSREIVFDMSLFQQHVHQSRMQTLNSDNNSAVARLPQGPQNSSSRNLGDSYEFVFHEDVEDQSAANSNNRNLPRNNSNLTRSKPANMQRKHCRKVGCEFFGDESYGGYCSGCFLEMTKKENPGQSECNSCIVILGWSMYATV